MRGARAWAAGDSGLWVPAPTHSRFLLQPPPIPQLRGRARTGTVSACGHQGPRGHGARATWMGAGGWKTPEG